jgi:hypothetical protein
MPATHSKAGKVQELVRVETAHDTRAGQCAGYVGDRHVVYWTWEREMGQSTIPIPYCIEYTLDCQLHALYYT